MQEENQEKGSDSIVYSVLTPLCVYMYTHKTNISCLPGFCSLSQFTRVSRDQCHVLDQKEESTTLIPDRESGVQPEL